MFKFTTALAANAAAQQVNTCKAIEAAITKAAERGEWSVQLPDGAKYDLGIALALADAGYDVIEGTVLWTREFITGETVAAAKARVYLDFGMFAEAKAWSEEAGKLGEAIHFLAEMEDEDDDLFAGIEDDLHEAF